MLNLRTLNLKQIPTWFTILVVCGVLPRLLLVLATDPIIWPDSLTYLASARNMVYHGNYWLHEIYRTPIYPLFLSNFLGAPHDPSRAGNQLILTQQVLGILTGLLFFLSLRRAFTPKIALVGATLFMLSPLQMFYEVTVLTEVQFTFFLALFIWLAGRIIEQSRSHQVSMVLSVSLSLAAALLTLSRPIGQFLWCAVWLFCVLVGSFDRRVLLQAMISLIVFIGGIYPWMHINYSHYGFMGVSRDFGINIFHRVIDVDHTPLPERSSDTLVRQIFLEAREKSEITYFRVYFALLNKIKEEGGDKRLVKLKTDQRMGNFALEVLRSQPLSFALNSINNFWRLFVSPRVSLHFCREQGRPSYLCSNHPGVSSTLFRSSPTHSSDWSKRATFHMLSTLRIPDGIVTLLFAIGIIHALQRSDRIQVTFMLTIIAYFTGIAAVFNCPEDRFKLPVNCLIYAFSTMGLAWALSQIRQRSNRACAKDSEIDTDKS